MMQRSLRLSVSPKSPIGARSGLYYRGVRVSESSRDMGGNKGVE